MNTRNTPESTSALPISGQGPSMGEKLVSMAKKIGAPVIVFASGLINQGCDPDPGAECYNAPKPQIELTKCNPQDPNDPINTQCAARQATPANITRTVFATLRYDPQCFTGCEVRATAHLEAASGTERGAEVSYLPESVPVDNPGAQEPIDFTLPSVNGTPTSSNLHGTCTDLTTGEREGTRARF